LHQLLGNVCSPVVTLSGTASWKPNVAVSINNAFISNRYRWLSQAGTNRAENKTSPFLDSRTTVTKLGECLLQEIAPRGSVRLLNDEKTLAARHLADRFY
jgi:hypothetical protein